MSDLAVFVLNMTDIFFTNSAPYQSTSSVPPWMLHLTLVAFYHKTDSIRIKGLQRSLCAVAVDEICLTGTEAYLAQCW